MAPGSSTDDLSREEIQDAVREAVRAELWSLLARFLWTVVAGFGVLLGVNLIQFGFLALGSVAGPILVAAGAVLVVLSVWLVLAEWDAFPAWTPTWVRG